jgi:DNA-binding transcriptional ArsR family regulator
MNIDNSKYTSPADLFLACAPLFAALSNSNRQAIIVLLAERKSMSVTELTSHLSLSQPTVSSHLKILHNCGLVQSQQKGTTRLYALDFKGRARLLKQLVEVVDSHHQAKAKENTHGN